jgi:hypothetical protein
MGKPVTLGVSPSPTGLAGSGVQTNDAGVATFADNIVIPGTALGDRQIRARVTDGVTQVSADSATFRLVNDLKACQGNRCENRFTILNNQQKFFNVITAGNGVFFDTNRNVILRSQQFATSTFGGTCAGRSYVSQGSEAVPQGTGATDSQPRTTMVIVISKDVLKAGGVTSRNAASFNACIGATWIGPGTEGPWITKTGTPTAQKVGTEWWGVAGDCSQFPANSPNPCVALKTKQVADLQAYLGPNVNASQFMKDSDLAIVIRKAAPWDGKGAVFK